jgi:hypothetical protein
MAMEFEHDSNSRTAGDITIGQPADVEIGVKLSLIDSLVKIGHCLSRAI